MSHLSVRPPGVLLVSPVLRVGLVSADGSLCKLLEVVCGSRSALPAGEDRGNRRFSYGRSLHRGGQLAAVQGDKLCRRLRVLRLPNIDFHTLERRGACF